MKLLLICLSLLLTSSLNAQSISETSIVIVSCKSGTLLIDGTSVGNIEANDAIKHTISAGEHYLQLKTATEKINETITIDKNSNGIIRIGCQSESKSEGIRLMNKEVELAGALSNNTDQNIFGFDAGDVINLSCSILNKKGSANITLIDYFTKQPVFSKAAFNNIVNEKITIPAKGIYYFSLYTDALFGKTARLIIDRIPSPNSNPNFKTSVKWVYDTTSEEIVRTTAHVFSVTNMSHTNKTNIKINLPPGTTYWTYWIGVGQDAQQQMKTFATSLSKAGNFFSANPLVLLGMRLIPSLPMFSSPETVSYHFTDNKNAVAFAQGQPYQYYLFKQGANITTDYSVVKVTANELVLSLENTSTYTGHDVDFRVVAFKVGKKLMME